MAPNIQISTSGPDQKHTSFLRAFWKFQGKNFALTADGNDLAEGLGVADTVLELNKLDAQLQASRYVDVYQSAAQIDKFPWKTLYPLRRKHIDALVALHKDPEAFSAILELVEREIRGLSLEGLSDDARDESSAERLSDVRVLLRNARKFNSEVDQPERIRAENLERIFFKLWLRVTKGGSIEVPEDDEARAIWGRRYLGWILKLVSDFAAKSQVLSAEVGTVRRIIPFVSSRLEDIYASDQNEIQIPGGYYWAAVTLDVQGVLGRGILSLSISESKTDDLPPVDPLADSPRDWGKQIYVSKVKWRGANGVSESLSYQTGRAKN